MSVRVPTALVGVTSSVLMFLLARRLFASDAMGLVAAGLLALTPAHFMHSRLALSIVYPLPFIIGWLMCLRHFDERGTRRALVAGCAVLALGVYSYLACVVMMPIYLLLSALPAARRGAVRQMAGPALLGFAWPLIPILLWQVAHPERYADLITAYRLHSGEAQTGASMGLGLLSYEAIRLRASLYWAFFSPDFLFVQGDSSFINSTRQIGFLPMACAVFIPAGIYQIVRHRSAMGLVVLLGLATAPMAGVISGQLEVNRLLFVWPARCSSPCRGSSRASTATTWARTVPRRARGSEAMFEALFSRCCRALMRHRRST
jgi:4-amino-4-deoxy-L-arabinose transferase-like glycosyltransferase